MRPLPLAGAAEVSEILGISRQRVNQLFKSDARFPKPVAELICGRIWYRPEIESYLRIRSNHRRKDFV